MLLYDTNGTKDVLVNELLVSEGFGQYEDKEKQFLQHKLVLPPDSSSPECWSTDSEAGVVSVPYDEFKGISQKTGENSSDADKSGVEEEEYDIVMDDPREFLRNMVRVSFFSTFRMFKQKLRF